MVIIFRFGVVQMVIIFRFRVVQMVIIFRFRVVGRCVYPPPPDGAVFQAPISRQAKRMVLVPPPNGRPSDSSRRDASNTDLCWHRHDSFQLWKYQPWEMDPGECDSVTYTAASEVVWNDTLGCKYIYLVL